MMRELSDLEPSAVWRWFETICAIPRPSGSEGAMADLLAGFAGERSLEWRRDEADNVLIVKDGSGDAAGHPPLLLQAHVDMVPEKKAESDHDFLRDPIRPRIEGDWVVSRDTTLGADNGIGVALMLAVLDSVDLEHPRLECLFTTDEERGLTGASNLRPEWISARRLINLDSEEQGVFTIGCAGGTDFTVFMEAAASETVPCRKLTVSGLRGGHSGIEIDKSRGNAIRILGRCLDAIGSEFPLRIGSVRGGSKRNAIPREAEAMVAVDPGDVARAVELMEELAADLSEEYRGIEDGILLSLEGPERRVEVLDRRLSGTVRDLLLALPHGVEKMSGVIPGLVETSVNLALLSQDVNGIGLDLTARSPLASARRALGRRIAAVARSAGCNFGSGDSYPGWMPDSDSEILAGMTGIYRRLFREDPGIESIHAGLECGMIGDRVGGMDMISIGPDIRDVHVPGERVSISSLQKFWRFFTAVLEELE